MKKVMVALAIMAMAAMANAATFGQDVVLESTYGYNFVADRDLLDSRIKIGTASDKSELDDAALEGVEMDDPDNLIEVIS